MDKGCKNCKHEAVDANEYPCNQCYPVMSGFDGVFKEDSVEHEKIEQDERVEGN